MKSISTTIVVYILWQLNIFQYISFSPIDIILDTYGTECVRRIVCRAIDPNLAVISGKQTNVRFNFCAHNMFENYLEIIE